MKFLTMTEFDYYNMKNTNTGYISFKTNYEYYSYVFSKNGINLCSRFKTANKLSKKLRNLLGAYKKNL